MLPVGCPEAPNGSENNASTSPAQRAMRIAIMMHIKKFADVDHSRDLGMRFPASTVSSAAKYFSEKRRSYPTTRNAYQRERHNQIQRAN